MEVQSKLLASYEKKAGVFNLLFALASIAFLILVIGNEILGGGDTYKYSMVILHFFIPLCLFLYLGFFHSPIRFTLSRSSIWLSSLSIILAGVIGYSLTRAFYNDFFSGLLNGGSSPVRLRMLLNHFHLSSSLESVCFTLVSVILCLLVIFFLFFLILFFLEAILLFIHNLREEPDRDSSFTPVSTRKRVLIASGFAILSFALCFFTLNKGQDWGADYALYIRQAFQLARGEVTGISEVWGLSLVFSLIYRLFGYDTLDYHTFLYYKIPGVISFAIAVFFLFLFFSKRFSLKRSSFLTALFAFNPLFVTFTNYIFTDLTFFMWCVISLICLERYYRGKTVREQVIFALLSGISVFFANFTRAAGMSLIATMLIVDLFWLLSLVFRRSKFLSRIVVETQVHKPLIRLLPYIIYGTLLFISYTIVPYFANTASISRYSSATVFIQNFTYYARILFDQFPMSFSPFEVFHFFVYFIVVPLFLFGILRTAKREVVLLIYFIVTYLGMHFVSALNGVRYTFPILFVILLFLVYGAEFAYQSLYNVFSNKKGLHVLSRLFSVLIVCFLFCSSVATAWTNMEQKRACDHFAFSKEAIATYHYIQECTPKDADIVFYKNEVVVINTDRTSYSTIDLNDDREQYLLITFDRTPEHQYIPDEYPDVKSLEQALGIKLLLKYQNSLFLFYRILPE